MPFEEYTDENGEKKTRYVAPEGTISKEPKEGFQEGGDFDLGASIGRTFGQAGRDFVQNLYDSVYDEIATYDPTGPTETFKSSRTIDDIRNEYGTDLSPREFNKIFNERREELFPSDQPGVIGKAFNMQPTSFDSPDADIPFLGKPFDNVAQNNAEHMIGGLLASIGQFALVAKGLKAKGVKVPQIPLFKGRMKTKLASKAPGVKGFFDRTQGRFIRGAQEGWLPGAINDFAIEDPWDGNMVNLLASGVPDGKLKNLLNEFAVTEDDTLAEARLKNGVVGTLIAGPLLGGSLEQLGGIKKEGKYAIGAGKREALKLIDAIADYFVGSAKVAKKGNAARGIKNPLKELTDQETAEVGIVKLTGREKKSATEQAVEIIQEQDKIQKAKDFPGTSGQQLNTDGIDQSEIEFNNSLNELEQARKNLEVTASRSKFIAESTGGIDEAKSLDLQPVPSSELATIGVNEIAVNPQRFQFKQAGQTPTGQSGSLTKITKYNTDLAGVVSVWRDPADGKTYVVNGHNRLAAAKRHQIPTINVRYLDAPDEATARVKGAMQNIAEGNGTGIDAAKIIRETKMGVEEMVQQGISPSGVVMKKAIPLSKLPSSLFEQVATARMTEDMGVAIGSSNAPDQVMFDLAKAAKKKGWSAAKTAEAGLIAKQSSVFEVKDPNALPLLGYDTLITSNFEKQLNVRIAIRQQLRSEINALGVAANTKKAGTLTDAGNVIDVDASKAARDESLQGEIVFNRLVGTEGKLSDLVNDLIKQVKGNKKAATVVQANIQKIKTVLKEEATLTTNKKQDILSGKEKIERFVEEQLMPIADAPGGGYGYRTDVFKIFQGSNEYLQTRKLELEKQGYPLSERQLKNIEKYSGKDPRAFARQLTKDHHIFHQKITTDEFLENLGKNGEEEAERLFDIELAKLEEKYNAYMKANDNVQRLEFDLEYKTIVEEQTKRGGINNNPTEINKTPDTTFVKQTTETVATGTSNIVREPELPKRLKGAKSRYRQMRVSFDNDIDKAVYIVTKRPNRRTIVEFEGGSKNNPDYIKFLMDDNGFTEQDIIRIADSLYDDFKANYREGIEYVAQAGYKSLGYKSGQLSLDPLNGINPIHKRSYGTLGNDYTGMNMLNYREKFELLEEIQRMAGKDVNVQFVAELEGTLTAKQAADYGLTEGDTYSAAGEFIAGTNPADDLIMISMFSKGGYRGFGKLLRTAFHESFHRIQKRLLSKADQKALIAGEKEIRELATKTMPEFRDSILDGTLGRQEIEAIAFSDWYMRNTDYPKATWAEPFKKIAQIIERTGNFLKGRGYQTWDDVFERSMRGETAEQAVASDLIAPATQLAIDPPDPDKLANEIKKNIEAINNGDMSIEEALKNQAADEPRRLISRSGKTQYVETPSEQLAASYKAFNDLIYNLTFDRAEATGIANLDRAMLFNQAVDKLRMDGGDSDAIISSVERALKGDPRSADDLIAIATLQLQTDIVRNKTGIQSQAYLSAPESEKGVELQRLKAMLGEQLKLDVAYMSVMRKTGQRLSMGKLMFRADDVDLSDLPSEVTLRKGTSNEAGAKVLQDGFDVTQETGAMGQAVYFTTDENSIKVMDGYDNAEIYGDLINDIKILDLSAMNKRLTDLVTDLGLGKVKKTKNGLELNPAQIEGIKAYLADRGYAGIRYEPRDTGRPNAPADEIAIFDNNSANRIVGSDASVPPSATPEAPKRTLLEQAIAKSEDLLNDKLDPKLLDAIESGELTQEAIELGDVMVAISNYSQKNRGFNKHISDLIEQTPKGGLTQRRLLNFYRGAILLSGETTWKMMIGGLYRAATLPVIQTMGGFTRGVGQSITGNKAEAYKSFRRARLGAMIYGQYYQNLGNALRLMGATIMENETFGNLGVDQMQLRSNSRYSPVDQLSLGSDEVQMRKKNDIWHADPNNKNFIANAALRVLSAVPKVTGRLAGGVDTFMSSLVGPSMEYVRFLDQELYHAETVLGMRPGSDEAFNYASDRAVELVKAEMVDVTLANGKKIENAALTGQNARYIMDWVNFTDSLDVVPAPRTYDYGVRKARESGITDPLDVHNFANKYINEGSNIFNQGGAAGGMAKASQAVGLVPKALGNVVENYPAFGLIYPLPRGPINIIKASARAFPITAPFVDTFWRDITSEDLFTRDRAIGEMALGTTTLAGGIALLSTGLVEFTGFRSTNFRSREVGPESVERGREPMSIRFKNPFSDSEEWTPWYSLQTFDTLSNIFGAIGEYVEVGNSLTEEEKEVESSIVAMKIAHVARALGMGQFSKQILSSITELFDVVAGFDEDAARKMKKGKTGAFSRYIERKLSSLLVPAAIRKINIGEARRDIVASELPFPFNVVSNTAQRIQLQIPGAREGLPPVLHNYSGDPIDDRDYAGTGAIPKDMPWLKFFYKMLTPTSAFPSRTKSTHPVDVELSKLYGKGSNYKPWNDNIFNLPGKVLNREELNRLITIGTKEIKNEAGNTLWEELTALVTIDPVYASLPYDVSSDVENPRMTMIKNVVAEFKEKAKIKFLEERPDINSLIEERDQKIIDKQYTRDRLNSMNDKQSRNGSNQFLAQLN
ncbi:hypothetical protein PSCSP1o_00021 [Prochlorococcus phage P-SCSP1o]|nr:hypothetical protein PSCSP1o_00021 [Prochlorococcus phage P-SCSP1o]